MADGWVQPGWVQPGWVSSGGGGAIRTLVVMVEPQATISANGKRQDELAPQAKGTAEVKPR